MIALLFACAPPIVLPGDPTTTTTTTTTSTTTTSTEPPPPFAQPPDAPDLDPASNVVRVELTADEHTYVVGDHTIEGYAYDGQVPGPTIRVPLGARLVVQLTNQTDVDTTIHWHGISVPYAMDGVTWQADPVHPGETFTYDFVVDRPGTFWYHPHFDSDRQVDLGLYGLVVVEDPADPPVDRELLLVLDDWSELEAEGEEHDHGAEPLPAEWAVNGVVAPQVDLTSGEVVRVRLLNASNTRYLDLADVRQIGSDQGLLPAPRDAPELVVAPGDRVELEWRVGGPFALDTLPYTLNGGPAFGETQTLLTAAAAGALPAPSAPPWPIDATPPTPDPGTTDVLYVFSGDGGSWMINGEVFPDVTIESLPLGVGAVIEVRNLSPTEHPFHLHGMSFEVLSTDGVPSPYRAVEDTVNVKIRGTVRLWLVPDNPGDWMAHCHILPHAHQGMMTVLRVGP